MGQAEVHIKDGSTTVNIVLGPETGRVKYFPWITCMHDISEYGDFRISTTIDGKPHYDELRPGEHQSRKGKDGRSFEAWHLSL